MDSNGFHGMGTPYGHALPGMYPDPHHSQQVPLHPQQPQGASRSMHLHWQQQQQQRTHQMQQLHLQQQQIHSMVPEMPMHHQHDPDEMEVSEADMHQIMAYERNAMDSHNEIIIGVTEERGSVGDVSKRGDDWNMASNPNLDFGLVLRRTEYERLVNPHVKALDKLRALSALLKTEMEDNHAYLLLRNADLVLQICVDQYGRVGPCYISWYGAPLTVNETLRNHIVNNQWTKLLRTLKYMNNLIPTTLIMNDRVDCLNALIILEYTLETLYKTKTVVFNENQAVRFWRRTDLTPFTVFLDWRDPEFPDSFFFNESNRFACQLSVCATTQTQTAFPTGSVLTSDHKWTEPPSTTSVNAAYALTFTKPLPVRENFMKELLDIDGGATVVASKTNFVKEAAQKSVYRAVRFTDDANNSLIVAFGDSLVGHKNDYLVKKITLSSPKVVVQLFQKLAAHLKIFAIIHKLFEMERSNKKYPLVCSGAVVLSACSANTLRIDFDFKRESYGNFVVKSSCPRLSLTHVLRSVFYGPRTVEKKITLSDGSEKIVRDPIPEPKQPWENALNLEWDLLQLIQEACRVQLNHSNLSIPKRRHLIRTTHFLSLYQRPLTSHRHLRRVQYERLVRMRYVRRHLLLVFLLRTQSAPGATLAVRHRRSNNPKHELAALNLFDVEPRDPTLIPSAAVQFRQRSQRERFTRAERKTRRRRTSKVHTASSLTQPDHITHSAFGMLEPVNNLGRQLNVMIPVAKLAVTKKPEKPRSRIVDKKRTVSILARKINKRALSEKPRKSFSPLRARKGRFGRTAAWRAVFSYVYRKRSAYHKKLEFTLVDPEVKRTDCSLEEENVVVAPVTEPASHFQPLIKNVLYSRRQEIIVKQYQHDPNRPSCVVQALSNQIAPPINQNGASIFPTLLPTNTQLQSHHIYKQETQQIRESSLAEDEESSDDQETDPPPPPKNFKENPVYQPHLLAARKERLDKVQQDQKERELELQKIQRATQQSQQRSRLNQINLRLKLQAEQLQMDRHELKKSDAEQKSGKRGTHNDESSDSSSDSSSSSDDDEDEEETKMKKRSKFEENLDEIQQKDNNSDSASIQKEPAFGAHHNQIKREVDPPLLDVVHRRNAEPNSEQSDSGSTRSSPRSPPPLPAAVKYEDDSHSSKQSAPPVLAPNEPTIQPKKDSESPKGRKKDEQKERDRKEPKDKTKDRVDKKRDKKDREKKEREKGKEAKERRGSLVDIDENKKGKKDRDDASTCSSSSATAKSKAASGSLVKSKERDINKAKEHVKEKVKRVKDHKLTIKEASPPPPLPSQTSSRKRSPLRKRDELPSKKTRNTITSDSDKSTKQVKLSSNRPDDSAARSLKRGAPTPLAAEEKKRKVARKTSDRGVDPKVERKDSTNTSQALAGFLDSMARPTMSVLKNFKIPKVVEPDPKPDPAPPVQVPSTSTEKKDRPVSPNTKERARDSLSDDRHRDLCRGNSSDFNQYQQPAGGKMFFSDMSGYGACRPPRRALKPGGSVSSGPTGTYDMPSVPANQSYGRGMGRKAGVDPMKSPTYRSAAAPTMAAPPYARDKTAQSTNVGRFYNQNAPKDIPAKPYNMIGAPYHQPPSALPATPVLSTFDRDFRDRDFRDRDNSPTDGLQIDEG